MLMVEEPGVALGQSICRHQHQVVSAPVPTIIFQYLRMFHFDEFLLSSFISVDPPGITLMFCFKLYIALVLNIHAWQICIR
jgi:hypothetical protein